jgi:Helix-turn-helix domain
VSKSSVKLHLENLQLRTAIVQALNAGVDATPEEAALYLGKSPGYLAIMRHEGTGPKFALSGTSVRYTKQALDEWKASCKLRRSISSRVGRPARVRP